MAGRKAVPLAREPSKGLRRGTTFHGNSGDKGRTSYYLPSCTFFPSFVQPFPPRSVFTIEPVIGKNHHTRVNSHAISDNDLMFQVRDGDIAKLGILFERHHGKLYNFLVRLTNRREASEDLVQEVFFRMMKYGHSFRGDAPFAVWMYQLARNAATDYFRKWRHESPMDEQVEETLDDDPLPFDAAVRNEEAMLLKQALARLAADKREVLVLTKYQELKLEEVAKILECPVGTVKAKIHRALKDLKAEYEKLSGTIKPQKRKQLRSKK
jgi:RNA polymerase sigma-70 factor (ECF subfamily)